MSTIRTISSSPYTSAQQQWIPRQHPPQPSTEGPLSQKQLADFQQKGFIFEPNFLSPQEVEHLTQAMHGLLETPAYKNKEFVIMEPTGQHIRSIFAVHFLNKALRALAYDPRLTRRAEQILGSQVYIHQSRINYKPGFEGQGFNWHSDFETWHYEDGMPEMRAVSASIIMTDNHHFNGPLMLVPGSHEVFIPSRENTPEDHYKQSLQQQEIGVPPQEALSQLMQEHGIEAVTGKAGGLILFDCNVIHGSNANMSADPRSNIFFVYNSVENQCVAPFSGNAPRPEFLAHPHGKQWQPH